MATPKSKGAWGKRAERTSAELESICDEFFSKLQVPDKWKYMGRKDVVDPQLGIISKGKVFRDLRTSGADMKEYRVCFFTFSERGGVVEKSIVDFSKRAYLSLDHGIFKIDELNKFIYDRFNELQPTDTATEAGENDPDDGLQHFRDRFGTGVVPLPKSLSAGEGL